MAFARSMDACCVSTADGYLAGLNPAWKMLLGWSRRELMARPCFELAHPDDRSAMSAAFLALGHGAAAMTLENRCRHKDGSYRALQWQAQSSPDHAGIRVVVTDGGAQPPCSGQVVDIVDREKRRMGRELHDGLCQSLAGIAALSSALSRELTGAGHDDLAAHAREINQLLGGALGDVRDMAHGLGSATVRNRGLTGALEALARNVRHMFDLDCVFESDRAFPRCNARVETHVFRIAQESVNNAVTHGRPNRIEIDLRRRRRQGILSIRDNGVGLPEDVFLSGGLGLKAMAYRAHLIDAVLDVRRRRLDGTAVICKFPSIERPDRQHEAQSESVCGGRYEEDSYR